MFCGLLSVLQTCESSLLAMDSMVDILPYMQKIPANKVCWAKSNPHHGSTQHVSLRYFDVTLAGVDSERHVCNCNQSARSPRVFAASLGIDVVGGVVAYFKC